jgi:threonine dehydrogenase-like Zn-dependent dehydrogenase
MSTAQFIVQLAPRAYELRECAIPPPGPDAAIARVAACAICGTDLAVYKGIEANARYPLVPGHEPIGIIEAIGKDAATRWGVTEGDRVIVGSGLACGRCELCRNGRGCIFGGSRLPNFGYRHPEEWPYLWGGFGTHLYLPPQSFFLRAPSAISTPTLSLFNSVGNAWHWIVEVGCLGSGDVVLIFGPGPRGLAATAIAAMSGASQVVVVGLPGDQYRLNIASALGATATFAEEPEDLWPALADAFGYTKVDLVVDATSGGADLNSAISLIGTRGRIVVGGLRHGAGPGIKSDALDQMVLSEIKLSGARSSTPTAMQAAFRLLGLTTIPWASIATNAITLEQVSEVMESLADVGLGETRVHVRIEPNQ